MTLATFMEKLKIDIDEYLYDDPTYNLGYTEMVIDSIIVKHLENAFVLGNISEIPEFKITFDKYFHTIVVNDLINTLLKIWKGELK